jgi:membrane-associated phospholipid phosphatase
MTEKISCIVRNLLIWGLVSLNYTGIGYSQNLWITDSVSDQSTFSSNSKQHKISDQKPSHNFLKTDSIFSFCSPKGYFPSLLHNFGEQTTTPFRFRTKEWIITGAAVAITVSFILFDNDIDEWARVQKQEHNWINKSSPIITQLGGYYGVYAVVSTGLISAAFKNEKGVQTSLLATQALITSGVWVHLIKTLSGRERPEAAYIFSKSEGGKWYGPFAMYDQDLAVKKPGSAFDSFPSGHTAAAFSIATVFASQYSDIKAIPVICYSAATLVGISRLTEHAHWASDVFVGGLLGYVCGRQVVAHHNKTHQNPDNSLSSKSKSKTEFTFNQDGNQIGLSLKW